MKEFMELEPGEELTRKAQKLCQEENGGFRAVIIDGVKGYLATNPYQFIPLEDL
jgi:hypothetical protein